MVSNLNPHPLPLIGCLLSLTIFFWWSPIAPTETLAKLGSLLPSEPTVLLFRSFCHLLCLSNFQSSQVLHSLSPKTWCHLTWASVSLSFHHLRVRPMQSIILSCALFASPDRRLLEVRVLYPYHSWDPLCPWDFPGQNTGVGCHFLLQGIFLTPGSNLHLLLGRQILYHWATWEARSLIYPLIK